MRLRKPLTRIWKNGACDEVEADTAVAAFAAVIVRPEHVVVRGDQRAGRICGSGRPDDVDAVHRAAEAKDVHVSCVVEDAWRLPVIVNDRGGLEGVAVVVFSLSLDAAVVVAAVRVLAAVVIAGAFDVDAFEQLTGLAVAAILIRKAASILDAATVRAELPDGAVKVALAAATSAADAGAVLAHLTVFAVAVVRALSGAALAATDLAPLRDVASPAGALVVLSARALG